MSAVSRFFPYNLVLPNMPGVAAQLMRSFNDDNMTLNGLADLIGKDPALSAKVLRLANSARYSPLRSVSSLREATASLGMTMLRNLTMATCLSGSFPTIVGLDRARFWRHGIATAHYYRKIGQYDVASGCRVRTASLHVKRSLCVELVSALRAC